MTRIRRSPVVSPSLLLLHSFRSQQCAPLLYVYADGSSDLYFTLNSIPTICRYLDYIEEKKDIGMIIRLYERCLVACASYPGTHFHPTL